jgi:endonuclease/exonuclease/phosphatase family metal-dependent hydrolase
MDIKPTKKEPYKNDPAKIDEFTSFVMDQLDADILCAQESNRRVEKWIGKYYPYHHSVEKAGTAIYSRYPFIDRGHINFGTGTITNSCVWADVQLPNDTIRVYSAHLQSNMITSDANKLVEEVETNQEVDFMNVRTILGKYKRYVAKRSHQATMVRNHLNESPHPVILAADLNDPPVSYTHRILAKDHTDSFVAAGNGMGITYAGHIPLLRIDNVILSNDFEVLDHKVIRKRFSDHYPVRVEVNLD